MVAQRLYEAGRITYMRTDSVNLSALAIEGCKTEIERLYGEDYGKVRKYQTHSKGAQEAHEAIRPLISIMFLSKEQARKSVCMTLFGSVRLHHRWRMQR